MRQKRMYVAISWEGWPETRRGGSGRGEEEGGHASSWLTRLARSGRCLLPHRRASPPRRACPRADRPTPARHARRPPLRGMSLEAIRLELRRRAEEERAAVDGNNELLRRRRADAVWVDISDARHPVVEVHEIKVTKADLEAELRRPEKSAPWMQRAHKFWLTIPEPHLANDVSVPDTWGILRCLLAVRHTSCVPHRPSPRRCPMHLGSPSSTANAGLSAAAVTRSPAGRARSTLGMPLLAESVGCTLRHESRRGPRPAEHGLAVRPAA